MLLLLFAAVVPVDFVFFIHCYGIGDGVLRKKIWACEGGSTKEKKRDGRKEHEREVERNEG